MAEIANAMWEGAEGDPEADTQIDAEPPRELEGTLVREREAAESVSSELHHSVRRPREASARA